MFRKILIANRGEIACRVAATARRLGVRTVAVYSDADARARHVQACDEAVHIGGNAPRESYLQWQRIIDAALATGAQAVHPGYGFLSENEAFANACVAAGLVFIGPPASAIAAMGSKSAAKALMEKAGVPLVPGYHGDDNTPAFLAAQAARIGYPVLIKASAGGGGKGMRRVDRAEDFEAALAGCQREARASFGNDHVLVERYVLRPRHIEIQVFGDHHGHVIHLGERDCSVQRRHQKVLEESPAPGLSAARRAEMGAAAVAAAQAVGYVGAGTVEFVAEELDDGDIRAYFMEMNTRLQVEHPVTEAVTGLDLVEWQLRVASGEPLPLTQGQVALRGHAIEARVCAENPDADFLPATGALRVLRWPEHVAFTRSEQLPRVDSGVREGDEISPHYDSMIAKLIVWGETREQALARLDAALQATQVMGPSTNVAFLRRVAASHSFATADLDTGLIVREHAALFEAPPLAPEVVAGAVAAHVLAAEAALEDADPWSRRDGWRLHGGAQRLLHLEHLGRPLLLRLSRQHDGALRLAVGEGGVPLPFSARSLGDGRHELHIGPARLTAAVHAQGERYAVFTAAGSALLADHDPLVHAGQGAAEGRLTAPMPGKVVGFLAAVGDRVEAGQALAVMEAMKMEHTINAPHDGVVQELLYAAGDQVAEGSELLRLETT
ncbi:MAG: 3-methylcrotonyl-CoA carboxylase [Leptothrix sp. (in: Bacteria)]|nr:3-methylcrotonyl-CoA carboxylase [Leptothrix sp. (in: b-proteobacteria)]